MTVAESDTNETAVEDDMIETAAIDFDTIEAAAVIDTKADVTECDKIETVLCLIG